MHRRNLQVNARVLKIILITYKCCVVTVSYFCFIHKYFSLIVVSIEFAINHYFGWKFSKIVVCSSSKIFNKIEM